MEICFVADNNYKRFIKEYTGEKFDKQSNDGVTLNVDGQEIGRNPGYMNYTIGQRKGIGLTNSEPLYVTKIDSKNNSIMVSEKQSLFSKTCDISNINWLIDNHNFPMKANCQIRYNGNISKATLTNDSNRIQATFLEPQLAITPGQSIVFFNDDETLLGGGIIELT